MPAAVDFPALPIRADDLLWSGNVQQTYTELRNTFRHGQALLAQQNADPLQYRLCIDGIAHNMIPFLVALEESSEVEGVPVEWVEVAARCFVDQLRDLTASLQNAENR